MIEHSESAFYYPDEITFFEYVTDISITEKWSRLGHLCSKFLISLKISYALFIIELIV